MSKDNNLKVVNFAVFINIFGSPYIDFYVDGYKVGKPKGLTSSMVNNITTMGLGRIYIRDGVVDKIEKSNNLYLRLKRWWIIKFCDR